MLSEGIFVKFSSLFEETILTIEFGRNDYPFIHFELFAEVRNQY